MEIIIHGTKDGYRTLYDKTDGIAYNILKDIRNGAKASDSLFGKTFYSLAFVANGCVYTKYVIIKDSLRSFATGTIAFSVFIGTGETMKTEDILKLLNDLYLRYQSDNIRDNNLNRGERELIRENWDFVKDITNEYKTTPKNGIQEEMLSGTKDPAYIYYQDDSDLLRYFDKPFQDEYKDFSQVLLIQSNLQGDANPLNVLKNSGVELKDIDLKNEPYYLANYDRSKGLTILANGKPRSEGRNNNQIRAKEEIVIKYLKNERFYEPIEAKGTIINSTSEIHKFLKIDGNQIFIKQEAFNNPIAKTKKITFYIKPYKGGLDVSDAEIQIGTQPFQKINGFQFEHPFVGEELGKSYTVSAKKGDNLKSEEQSFIPENQNSPVEITLNEYKTVKFTGESKETKQYFTDIKITIPRKNISTNTPEVVFENDEINQSFEVIATYQRNGNSFEGKKTFTPKNGDVTIELKKVEVKTYRIDAGENGRKSDLCPGYSNKEDGSDIKSHIKPNKGWKFTGFELNESKTGDYDGTLVAQYEKKPFFANPKVIIASVVAVLVLGLGIWSLFFKSDVTEIETSQALENEITTYIEGTELFDNKLTGFKSQWENQKPEIKIEKKSWLSMFGIGNKEEKIDSTDYKKWEKVSKSIERAIAKRNYINNYNFDLLKTLDDYSTKQQTFKTAIISVDNTKYEELKNEFKEEDISSWDLNKIAESINDFLNPSAESEETVQTDEKNITVVQAGQTTNTASNNTDEIAQKLKSNTITKQQLEEWKNDTGKSKYKKNIDLYLEFWNSVNNDQKSVFDDLLKKVNNDNVLKNSELKRFLDGICANPEAFQKYNSAPGKATCKTINELRETMK